jgi:membrane-associated phospholipid phosphatase
MDCIARSRSLIRLDSRAASVGRVVLLVAYLALVAYVWKQDGVPLERLQVLGWIAGALVIATTGRPDGGIVRIIRDWLPIGVVLAAYDLSRGVADTLGMPIQMGSVVQAERIVAFGHIPTVVAQQHLGPYTGPARWWEVPVALAYLSHFVVPFAVLGALWAIDRWHFRRYRNTLLLLTAMGLTTYVLLPGAPPWLASRSGLIGPVQRVGLRGMELFGLQTADALVRYGPRFGNTVAALPSLHAGWAALSAIWFAGRVRRRWWPLLAAYPLLMGFSLVVSGEHYVVDVLMGYGYAALAVGLGIRLNRWLERPRRRRQGAVIDLRPSQPADEPAGEASPVPTGG